MLTSSDQNLHCSLMNSNTANFQTETDVKIRQTHKSKNDRTCSSRSSAQDQGVREVLDMMHKDVQFLVSACRYRAIPKHHKATNKSPLHSQWAILFLRVVQRTAATNWAWSCEAPVASQTSTDNFSMAWHPCQAARPSASTAPNSSNTTIRY